MPRRNRPARGSRLPGSDPTESPPSGAGRLERHEQWQGLEYAVRSVAGTSSAGPYRCPGCDQEIRAKSPHVVVWPVEDLAAEDRRHWHTVCWRARDRRTPDVQRGRSNPRH